MATHDSNTIIKFADDNLVGLIPGDEDSLQRAPIHIDEVAVARVQSFK
jgi:hypothetical protein